VRSLLGSILLNFVKIVKFVGCSKLELNLIKLNKHLYMTINVIEVFFYRLYNYNLYYIQQVLFVDVNKNVQVYGY
jgi:hypothetical protein